MFNFQIEFDNGDFQVLKILFSFLTHLIDLEFYDHISELHIWKKKIARGVSRYEILGIVNWQRPDLIIIFRVIVLYEIKTTTTEPKPF